MFKIASYLPYVLMYNIEKAIATPKTLPLNITLSVTDRCNSCCKTCNVWKKDNHEELDVEEYEKIFEDFNNLFWVTITGGEPTLRDDTDELIRKVYDSCEPDYITISTNGYNYYKLMELIKGTINYCNDTEFVVNFSFDAIGDDNDYIRGTDNAYERTKNSYLKLKNLSKSIDRLTVGINTVISKFNIDDFKNIHSKLMELDPDSYIVEIAENRAKLYNEDLDIMPESEKYKEILSYLIENMNNNLSKTGSLVNKLRKSYYRFLINDLHIRDFEGIGSAYIMPDGEVWLSYSDKDNVGNIADYNYSFKDLWRSEEKDKTLEAKDPDSGRHLANAYYTNVLCNPYLSLKVLL